MLRSEYLTNRKGSCDKQYATRVVGKVFFFDYHALRRCLQFGKDFCGDWILVSLMPNRTWSTSLFDFSLCLRDRSSSHASAGRLPILFLDFKKLGPRFIFEGGIEKFIKDLLK